MRAVDWCRMASGTDIRYTTTYILSVKKKKRQPSIDVIHPNTTNLDIEYVQIRCHILIRGWFVLDEESMYSV